MMDSPPLAECPQPNSGQQQQQNYEEAVDLMSIHSPIKKMPPPDDDNELLLLNNRKNSETIAEKIEGNFHRRNGQIEIAATATIVPKTPPLTFAGIGMHSDEDSVCADIDRWASSSMDGDETSRGSSQMGGSARLQELEAEQQRLSESMLALSTQFAQIQFRIQQIAQAPTEQRDDMLTQLQEFASKSCLNFGQLKSTLMQNGPMEGLPDQNGLQKTAQKVEGRAGQVRLLIGELRSQLGELEQFAWQNGHLPPEELPLSELRARQRLVLEKLREKMRLQVELAGPEADADEAIFRRKLDEGLELAMEPIREKDQLVHQLRTQITDLERYVHLLQREVLEAAESRSNPSSQPCSPSKKPLTGDAIGIGGELAHSMASIPMQQMPMPGTQNSNGNGGFLTKWFGCSNARRSAKHFERNELKQTPLGNHYGDQRAEMELAVDALMQVMKKNQIFSVDREDRAGLSVDELNQVVLEGGQEAILSSVRKRLCPALRSLLEHGLKPFVTASPRPSRNGLIATIGCFPDRSQQLNSSRYLRPADLGKFDGRKLGHIWDVMQLFLEASRALEMRDAVVGQLSDAFKLETVGGKTATSKQILLSTIEHINNSHLRLRRSQDCMWKAFVCAALNRTRLPAWIRIIFRSELVLSKCYNQWSYVARTGVEDIRPLLEGLHQYNFDLPVDLAIRPFDQMKEAFG